MRLRFLRGGSAAMASPAAATPVPCGWRVLARAARGLTEPVSRSRRKQKELEEQERERRREEKLRRRAQRQRERELRRGQRKLERLQAEEQRKLQEKIRLEERKLLLAQRNLQSIRLIAELLSRAKVPPAAPAGRGAPARGWGSLRGTTLLASPGRRSRSAPCAEGACGAVGRPPHVQASQGPA